MTPNLSDVRVLTFDLYGTIVDMQRGLTETIAPFLQDRGYTGNPHSVVTWWRRTHYQDSMIDALIDGGHTPYREIGRRALSYTLTRAGVPFADDDIRTLVSAIERLPPFPDVAENLNRLRSTYRLAILSNGDTDMLHNASAHHGIHFDALISIDQAGAFKPHRVTYEKTAEILKTPIATICHVATHPFDCIGAKASGMRTAYVNRRQLVYGFSPHRPDLEVAGFGELADALTTT
jgi:2-haloacid dehalogenase